MAKVQHKAKAKRTGSKSPAAKTAKAKVKRAAPKETRKRKQVVTSRTREIRPEAPVAQAPVAVAARREPQGFPFFWPPFAMMRMWLGPRHTR